jgi:uncharacterized glyoxalase superfamily protein PhnB
MQDRRQKPETLRLRSIMPSLTVEDLAASLAWYRDVLGFHVVQEMNHEGKLVGASVRAGAVEVLLIQDDFAKGRGRKKGEGLRLYCTTAMDLDRLAEAIVERGGTLAQEPRDEPWGARDFAVTDPDGFQISISSPLPG